MGKTSQYKIRGISFDAEPGCDHLSGGPETVHEGIVVQNGRIVRLVEAETATAVMAVAVVAPRPRRGRYRAQKKGED